MKHKSFLIAFMVFVSILSLPFNVFATQQLSIGESENVYLDPSLPSGAWITSASWTTDVVGLECSYGDTWGTMVTAHGYWEDIATVSCLYTYSYYGVDDRIHVSHGEEHYYFTCKGYPITLTPTSITLDPGETSTLTFSISGASIGQIPARWVSSNEKVATVSSSGTYSATVRAKEPGNCVITCYSYMGKPVTCSVKVNSAEPTSYTVTASPGSGTYEKGTKIYLSASVSGATIRYTTDGSTPTSSDKKYSTPITLNESFTLKARAYNSSGEGGEVLTCEYTVEEPGSSALSYEILSYTDKTVEVVAKDKECEGDIVIPAKVNINGVTYKVVRIGDSAFEFCDSLTSITIPKSVTTIGDDAFHSCDSLTSIIIPNSVTTIGDYAFKGCSSLTSITIPNSVTTIGDYAFLSCDSLTSINVNAANQAYSSKDGVLYNKDQTSLISCPGGKFGELIVPNSVTTIGDYAFRSCYGLTSITIPNSVTTIGDYAFRSCYGLTSITIPKSVTTIGDDAFAFCSSLTSITLPNSVTTIGEWAFESCYGLTSITLPNSVTTIGKGAFSGCSSLTSINVDAANQVYSSKDGVLYNKEQTSLISCPGGKFGELIVPNSVTTIGEWAFESCDGLTSITLPNSVTTIGEWAFESCDGLTSITLPNSVTTIGDDAFAFCSSLTSITLPNSVTTIGESAFMYCSSLTSVTSLAVTPPGCGKNAFSNVDTDNCPLYVPAKSIQAYKQASEWKKFAKIEAADVSGVDEILSDCNVELPCEVYNINGVKVADSLEGLAPGIYIVHQGAAVMKIVVK